jgi:membrane protein DedA with SNARE-associated domain
MQSLPFIAWCLEHLNYWVITLLMAIESSFIPFPSAVVVPPAAYLAASGSQLNVFLVVLCATIGALIGAIVNYALARYLGRPIIYRFANSRFGHMCLIDEEKVRMAEEYFDRHGALGTFVGRLVPAVRQLISIPAGLSRMSISRFLLYTTLGAGAWNCILAALGWWMYSFVPENQLESKIMEYGDYIKYAILALVVLAILYFIVRHFMKKGK